jgi:hypothetical protein
MRFTAADIREVALMLALRQHCFNKAEHGTRRTMADTGADPVVMAGYLYALSHTAGDPDEAAGYLSTERSSGAYVHTADTLAHIELAFRPEVWPLREIIMDGWLRWFDRGFDADAWGTLVMHLFVEGTQPEALTRRRTPLPDVQAFRDKKLAEPPKTRPL